MPGTEDRAPALPCPAPPTGPAHRPRPRHAPPSSAKPRPRQVPLPPTVHHLGPAGGVCGGGGRLGRLMLKGANCHQESRDPSTVTLPRPHTHTKRTPRTPACGTHALPFSESPEESQPTTRRTAAESPPNPGACRKAGSVLSTCIPLVGECARQRRVRDRPQDGTESQTAPANSRTDPHTRPPRWLAAPKHPGGSRLVVQAGDAHRFALNDQVPTRRLHRRTGPAPPWDPTSAHPTPHWPRLLTHRSVPANTLATPR